LVHPLALTTIIWVVFRHFLPAAGDPRTFPIYVLSGLTCWNFLVSVTTQGCRCLHQGESYIRQFPAPIVIYPLRTVLGALIHFSIALLVVLVLSWYFNGFGNWAALPSLAPALLLLFLLGWALAVLASFANVYFQDTQHLCEVGFQILFYATPIVWMPSMFVGGRFEKLLRFHPLVPFLDLLREPIIAGHSAGLRSFVLAGVIVSLVGGLAIGVLARLQRVVIFRL
jgi:ABC-type polysaccharide/polyol phosphate export permease